MTPTNKITIRESSLLPSYRIKGAMSYKLPKLLVSLTLLALVSACGGGNKVVTTTDNSAEYKSAKSLPPLSKPSTVTQTANTQVAKAGSIADDGASTPNAGQAVAEKQTVTLAAVSSIEEDTKHTRLKIGTEFDQAWQLLSADLQKSDLTIFSRNKAAGRFSVGCANVYTESEESKTSGWSFFNRNRQQKLEYCAIELSEKRGSTIVSVFNRANEEVSAEYSKGLFTRLLNK